MSQYSASAFLGDGRQHFVNNERDILLRCARKFLRHRVRAEKGWDELQRGRFVQLPNDPKYFQLFFERKPVTGFGLHRGRAAAQKPLRSPLREGEQLCFGGGSGFPHRRADTAATRRNLFISCAARPQLEFIDAVPAENRMRMGVDKSGKHRASPRLDDIDVVRQAASISSERPTFLDHSVAHQHSAIDDDSEFAHCRTYSRSGWSGQGNQLRRV